MNFTISLVLPGGGGGSGISIRLPDECPRCHRHIDPRPVVALGSEDQRSAQILMRCPSTACAEGFISNYEHTVAGWLYKGSVPLAPKAPNIPERVAAISERFVTIYKQALAAEAQGLDQVQGIGLRKALEFLVKDYLVSTRPEDERAILKTMLGPCIDQYVDDPKVKSTAKRAAWLGNDEAHYLRVWGTKDIADLKVLLHLTQNWIESSLLTAEYETDMPEKRKDSKAP